ncbi:Bifunctional protein GlmU OS=Rhodanobacter lindaniclasticus OX=75310 GN=glmU PE=3 SV=1 [Rhodanobacter lindaniclasticus]
MPRAARVPVLYGNVPLTRAETLRQRRPAEGGFSLLTTRLANPQGYGRVLCDGNGHVREVVEEKDANSSQRASNLVNTGILVVEATALRG